jgi:hypothetical protein
MLRRMFHELLAVMDSAFRRLEAQVPPPKPVPWRDEYVLRYAEKTIEQALIQKLARVISGLRAVDILLYHGHVQEQGVLHRTIDELNDDVLFLAAARTNDTVTDLHERFLEAFWVEEFDVPEDPIASTQKRDTPPRRKIRAYITRILGEGLNPSRQVDVGETISKTYSGFVHGASPHIMDMCGGDPPRFHLAGMRGTVRINEYADDAWNYFYRSFISVIVAAKAFGDESLVEALEKKKLEFETTSGKDYEGEDRIAT